MGHDNERRMACSWISRHEVQSGLHGVWFVVHDMGFVAAMTIMMLQGVAIVCRGWWLHRWLGSFNQVIVFPMLIMSGIVLCAGVRPRGDWVVFASYGASWSLLCLQMASHRIMKWLHGLSLIHNAHALVHLRSGWGLGRNRDLFVILSVIPWIHLDWAVCVQQSWDRSRHIATGIDIMYMGLMGTVFSFTHDPYLHYEGVWLFFVVMHMCCIIIRKGRHPQIADSARRTIPGTDPARIA